MPILHSHRHGNEVLFALDTRVPVAINPWEFYLRGWFIASAASLTEVHRLGVLIDGHFVPAVYGLPRPDVGLHFADPALANCGFHVRFQGPKTKTRITLVAVGASRSITLAEVDAVPGSAQGIEIESYDAWMLRHDAGLTYDDRKRYASVSDPALISVIVATHQPDLFSLERCVQSVLGQRYSNWQLCISADASTGAPSLEYLSKIAQENGKIRLATVGSRVGIADSLNRLVRDTDGEFLVTLGQSDVLHPYALMEVASSLNARVTCNLIYSDEDRIDIYGSRSHPVFKPDIDLDALLSFNYLGGLIAYRRSMVAAIGGFRSEYEGSHDWDFLIRLVERVDADSVAHIPKPLYHRGTSQAEPLSRKHQETLVRVLSDYVERRGMHASVEPGVFTGSLRLKYRILPSTRVAIYCREEDGSFQIRTLLAGASRKHPLSIHRTMDDLINAKRDVDALPDVFVFVNRPLESLNHGFLEELTSQALRSECGLVTGISVNAEGRTLHTGFVRSSEDELVDPFADYEFQDAAKIEQLNVTRSVETISDEFFAVRREILVASGGLNGAPISEMPELVSKLVTYTHHHRLRVIVTPFAIASFHAPLGTIPVKLPPIPNRSGVALNPNILIFKDRGKMTVRDF